MPRRRNAFGHPSAAERRALSRALPKLLRALVPIDEAVAKFNADLQPIVDLAEAFDRRLAEAKAAHPDIDPAAVRAILFPPESGRPLSVLRSIRDLAVHDQVRPLLTAALPLLDTLPNQIPAHVLRAMLAALETTRAALAPKVAAAKVGRGYKWTPLSADEWASTIRELSRPGGRFSQLKRWPWIGDRIAALAAYLAPCIAGARRRDRKNNTLLTARPYKRNVLMLTAELVTAAYRPTFPTLHITTADVKARIQERRRTK